MNRLTGFLLPYPSQKKNQLIIKKITVKPQIQTTSEKGKVSNHKSKQGFINRYVYALLLMMPAFLFITNLHESQELVRTATCSQWRICICINSSIHGCRGMGGCEVFESISTFYSYNNH